MLRNNNNNNNTGYRRDKVDTVKKTDSMSNHVVKIMLTSHWHV